MVDKENAFNNQSSLGYQIKTKIRRNPHPSSGKYDGSQPEVCHCMERKNKYKRDNIRIGTINIITLTNKCEELVDMMERRKLKILGMSETKWKNTGSKTLRKGYKLYWSGHQDMAKNGVAFIIHKDLTKLTEIKYINDRIIKLTVQDNKSKKNIIQVYAPQVGSEQEEKDKFIDELEEQMNLENLIICGDLNAQVGCERQGIEEIMGPHGYGNKNLEGEHLIDFCIRNKLKIQNTWFKKQTSHKITRYSWDGQHKTVIDYILSDLEADKNITNVKVIPSEHMDSDHRLLVASLKTLPLCKIRTEKMPRIKTWKLEDVNNRVEYQRRITLKLPKCDTDGVEEEWKIFKNSFVNEAIDICGKTSKTIRDKETPWWSKNIRDAIKERNQAKKEMDLEKQKDVLVRCENIIQIKCSNYRSKKLKVKRLIQEEKSKCWDNFTSKLEEDSKSNKKLLFKVIKQKRSKQEHISNLETSDGRLVRTEEDIREELKNYFNKLLNTQDENIKDDADSNISANIEQEEEPIPTWLEIETALKDMRKGKSAGYDELNSDMIKAAGPVGSQWLARLLINIWKKNRIPEDWTKGIIIPIFKKGNRKICSNYRGITLLSHGLKIFEKIIVGRLRKIIEPLLEEEQHGFRMGRSTIDLIFATRILMEKHWEFDKNLIMVFLDIEKAYDSIPRETIWKCLEEHNVPNGLINKIKLLYKSCYSSVQVGKGTSDWFETKTGVQQGSGLSPIIFLVVMNKIIREVKKGGNSTKAMVFADDVMIWGETEQEVQEQLQRWNDKFKESGLKISKEKTEIMMTSRSKSDPDIRLNGVPLKSVENFKYLGSVIADNSLSKKEVVNRTKLASNFYNQIRHLLWDKHVPQKSKLTLYKTYFVPILTYGLETCTLTKPNLNSIQATEMKFIRTMNQRTRRDRIRNKKNREDAGVETSIIEQIGKSKLRWFGHIMRMEGARTARRYFEMQVQGKRPRGRPRRRWIETVKEEVSARGKNWQEVNDNHLYTDRVGWRRLVNHTRETGVENR